jgi:hypothetical protein
MFGNGVPQARDRWRDLLVHRWPTALGVAVAAMTALDLGADAGFVPPLPVLIVLMALVYVGAAALGRRRASWVVLLAALPVAFFLPRTYWGDPLVVLPAAAAAFLVPGAVRGLLRKPGGLGLQAAGFLVFGAMALAAMYVAPGAGVYLVASALFGHAAWDAFHYARDRVVTRPYAEFCGVLDLMVGVAILVLA